MADALKKFYAKKGIPEMRHYDTAGKVDDMGGYRQELGKPWAENTGTLKGGRGSKNSIYTAEALSDPEKETKFGVGDRDEEPVYKRKKRPYLDGD